MEDNMIKIWVVILVIFSLVTITVNMIVLGKVNRTLNGDKTEFKLLMSLPKDADNKTSGFFAACGQASSPLDDVRLCNSRDGECLTIRTVE